MRDRTFVGESGRKYAGTEIVGRLWERGLAESLGPRREQNLALTLREVEHALDGSARRDSLLEEFHEHGSIRPTDDGARSEEHTSELQSQSNLVCRLLLATKK